MDRGPECRPSYYHTSDPTQNFRVRVRIRKASESDSECQICSFKWQEKVESPGELSRSSTTKKIQCCKDALEKHGVYLFTRMDHDPLDALSGAPPHGRVAPHGARSKANDHVQVMQIVAATRAAPPSGSNEPLGGVDDITNVQESVVASFLLDASGCLQAMPGFSEDTAVISRETRNDTASVFQPTYAVENIVLKGSPVTTYDFRGASERFVYTLENCGWNFDSQSLEKTVRSERLHDENLVQRRRQLIPPLVDVCRGRSQPSFVLHNDVEILSCNEVERSPIFVKYQVVLPAGWEPLEASLTSGLEWQHDSSRGVWWASGCSQGSVMSPEMWSSASTLFTLRHMTSVALLVATGFMVTSDWHSWATALVSCTAALLGFFWTTMFPSKQTPVHAHLNAPFQVNAVVPENVPISARPMVYLQVCSIGTFGRLCTEGNAAFPLPGQAQEQESTVVTWRSATQHNLEKLQSLLLGDGPLKTPITLGYQAGDMDGSRFFSRAGLRTTASAATLRVRVSTVEQHAKRALSNPTNAGKALEGKQIPTLVEKILKRYSRPSELPKASERKFDEGPGTSTRKTQSRMRAGDGPR